MIYSIIIPTLLYLITGISIGIAYGMLFLMQKRGLFFNNICQRHPVLKIYGLSIIRFLLLGITLYYLLPLSSQELILVMICFFVGFWATVARNKGI